MLQAVEGGAATPVRSIDVLVAGSGIAGLVTALAARQAGSSVEIVEKTPQIGGISAYSEAMAWIPGNSHARRAGLTDPPGDAKRYIEALAGETIDPKVVDAYLAAAPQALDFVESHSPVRYRLATGSCDYHSDLPGATFGTRALTPVATDARRLGPAFGRLRPPLPTTQLFDRLMLSSDDVPDFLAIGRSVGSTWRALRILARYGRDRLMGYDRGTRIAGGQSVICGLLEALVALGVEVRTDTVLRDLRIDSGRITQAVVERAGEPSRIAINKGVVLAGGGFPAAADITAEMLPHVKAGKKQVSLAPSTNTGDTIRLALRVGGVLGNDISQPVAWAPVSLVPRPGGPVGYPHFIDRQKPGMIAVDIRGRRFVNEADSYHVFVPAMLEATRDDPEAMAFLICDHRAIRRYGLGVAPPAPGRIGKFLRSGYLRAGQTIAELAAALGIDPRGLQETVAAFNGPAARGEDPAFGKGATAYNRSNGDSEHRPNPCVGPLDQAPYYGVVLYAGDLGTFCGLRTDEHARVVNEAGEPIVGLYAVGSDMASPMGGSYPGAGSGVGSALTFGYVAGRHAAGLSSEPEISRAEMMKSVDAP